MLPARFPSKKLYDTCPFYVKCTPYRRDSGKKAVDISNCKRSQSTCYDTAAFHPAARVKTRASIKNLRKADKSCVLHNKLVLIN